ncbi:uncharacterized protein PODANS_3_7900 [Podospora anserina S mat+]|uniref:Podospora anserina S mat+ genomic DNA chromosome 3, supercontig 2 n=1 Tax=Podospora anserina (strain S / ATCC MYA-4624 / DSM 980 / FGSC 10383) TaxID=515849 RepID=B2B103_PODAN|nr:uncharacterized protein PODANS_3_7900 [Podospora anserina S mat+]CAP70728.1 unnamed protein product [Podospora anserina S mat+]
MSGDENTDEWEPIPSLSSLSPFSSPALSFLLLSKTDLAHDSDHPSFHSSRHDDDVLSHTPPPATTPRPPKTPPLLTPSPPSTSRSMHGSHLRTPTQPSPLQLSSSVVGLGLGHLGIGPPMVSPLQQKVPAWMSAGHHEEVIEEETSITHDADDEDEEDERDEGEVMNRQSLIYDRGVDHEVEEEQRPERRVRRMSHEEKSRQVLSHDREADDEDEDEDDDGEEDGTDEEDEVDEEDEGENGAEYEDGDEQESDDQEFGGWAKFLLMNQGTDRGKRRGENGGAAGLWTGRALFTTHDLMMKVKTRQTSRQGLIWEQQHDHHSEGDTNNEVMNRLDLFQAQAGDDRSEGDTNDEVMERQNLPCERETDRLQQSFIYDHDQPTDEITQNSKAILVDRLEGLLHRLATSNPTADLDTIDILHAKVDEMERALSTTSPRKPNTSRRLSSELEPLQHSQETTAHSSAQEHPNQSPTHTSNINLHQSIESMPDTLSPSASLAQLRRSLILPPALATTPPPWLLPSAVLSPIKSSEIFSTSISSPTQPELDAAAEATNEALEAAKEAARAHSEMTERIAAEADELRRDLAVVVERLKNRREETDHIHTLLIQRAEAAAERILDLEKELSDLEDDLASSESELRHLRLKLRAVETLVGEFVDPDETDPELFRCIENWKEDWRVVRERMRERKRGRKERRTRLRRREMMGVGNEEVEEGEEEGESTLTSLGGVGMGEQGKGL